MPENKHPHTHKTQMHCLSRKDAGNTRNLINTIGSDMIEENPLPEAVQLFRIYGGLCTFNLHSSEKN